MANDHLTQEEKEFVGFLKELGIFVKLEGKRKWCTNGGVKCCCGDGTKDMILYHKKNIHPDTNLQTLAGGPLSYSFGFIRRKLNGDFSNKDLSIVMRGNVAEIKAYMKLKNTRTMFHCFHFPCGAAKDAGLTIKDIVIGHIPKVVSYFDALCFKDPEFFRAERVFYKFHVKKINSGGAEEQNTYLIDIPELRGNIKIIKSYKL